MTAAVSAESAFVRQPTVVSTAAGVGAGVVAVGLIADTPIQRRILAVAVLAVVALVAGGQMRRRTPDTLGALLILCGAVLGLGAVVAAVSRPPQFIHRIELLPGVAGLLVLAVALLPLRFRWSRVLVDAGVGLLFLAVIGSGIVQGASAMALITAAAATIFAWDAAENAVSLGGQIGADSATDTTRTELVHLGFSAGIAAVIIMLILVIARVGIDSLPFGALVALLIASIALVIVYHR